MIKILDTPDRLPNITSAAQTVHEILSLRLRNWWSRSESHGQWSLQLAQRMYWQQLFFPGRGIGLHHPTIPVSLPAFSKKMNLPVPVSCRLFSAVSGSDNKSCLYEYDVPRTSIYQKDRWNGIPESDWSIPHRYVLDFFLMCNFNSLFLIGSGISIDSRRTEMKWF